MSRPMRLLAIRFASQGASMGEEVRRMRLTCHSRLGAKRPVPATTRGVPDPALRAASKVSRATVWPGARPYFQWRGEISVLQCEFGRAPGQTAASIRLG